MARFAREAFILAGIETSFGYAVYGLDFKLAGTLVFFAGLATFTVACACTLALGVRALWRE